MQAMKLRDRLRRDDRPPTEQDSTRTRSRVGPVEPSGKGAAGDDWVSTISDWARRVVDSNFKRQG
jgi:hypothetical protein